MSIFLALHLQEKTREAWRLHDSFQGAPSILVFVNPFIGNKHVQTWTWTVFFVSACFRFIFHVLYSFSLLKFACLDPCLLGGTRGFLVLVESSTATGYRCFRRGAALFRRLERPFTECEKPVVWSWGRITLSTGMWTSTSINGEWWVGV